MAKLQQTLDALQPYVIGIRYLDGIPVVDAVFKDGWTLSESDSIEKAKGNDELNYYMIFSKKDGVGLDELLGYVETVIKENIEKEKKHELLKLKVNELKEIFKKNSLIKLNRLTFSFNDDLIPELDEFDLSDSITEPEVMVENKYISPGIPMVEYDTAETTPTETIPTEIFEDMSEENAEILAEELRAQNFKKIKDAGKLKNQVKNINSKVELPPKRKIADSISESGGDCNCGPEEACNKCIEHKYA
jgi:hypothetical protein